MIITLCTCNAHVSYVTSCFISLRFQVSYTGPVALVVGALASNFITTLSSVAAVGCTVGAAVLAVVVACIVAWCTASRS